MPCLKIVPEAYMNPDAAEVLIHKYVFRKAVRIGGLAVDPLHAAEQMEFYRSFFGQQKGRRLYHFIVAYTEEESKHITNEESLAMVAYEICQHFSDEYQIVFGIHHSNRMWHIHFVMNTVNYRTGLKYRAKRQDDLDLLMDVSIAVGDKVPIYYN